MGSLTQTLSASFRFGDRQQHVCRFQGGLFGRERYYVNDRLILDCWSLRMHGSRRFEAEGHVIEFRVIVSLTGAQGDAFVDGQHVASNLFEEFNARLRHPNVPKASRKTLAFEVGFWVLLVALLTLYFQQRS